MVKIVCVLLLFSASCVADISSQQLLEVKYLLAFVKKSPCQIIRNGAVHNGEAAAKHIEKKYNYYRDDISTTEEFIEYAATKSSISGKLYTVKCPGKEKMKTQDWLLNELGKIRQ